MTKVQEDSKNVLAEIVLHDYYQYLLKKVLERCQMTYEGIQASQYADRDLIKMWNDFWFSLPDAPPIRRHPFFQLCDLCESIFEGDEDDEEE